ncbi:hypothetical protein N0V93_008491 [Gnomoniopsis smithogilvyi]|uniref:AMMECR1 domain-containing protein n=1 Tax=Gnomoniopsis smithogilvyi TaxID=1191159 RepID=A0A9W9CUU0_9PEZI|nr:hypothetical protein N0V93_008491 [Gnomoniopsis smithogilvyi]
MATPEHCLYCFDSLASKLDKSLTPLSLIEVQNSYAAYLTHLKDSSAASSSSSSKKIPALTRLARLADASSSSSSLASGASSSSSTTTTTSLSTNTAATSTTSTTREHVTDPDARYPLFVTWDIKARGGEWHLRGCIGTFSAESPLSECLAEYAVISALHDTRFNPVSQAELPELKCAVTLLTNFEDCEAWDDWVVGEHGIKIRFKAKGRSYSGTYLPSVAAEQEWTKEETMLSLMRKAGWRGSQDSWREVASDASMQVERYRGDKEEVEFAEYQQWREWVNENWNKA